MIILVWYHLIKLKLKPSFFSKYCKSIFQIILNSEFYKSLSLEDMLISVLRINRVRNFKFIEIYWISIIVVVEKCLKFSKIHLKTWTEYCNIKLFRSNFSPIVKNLNFLMTLIAASAKIHISVVKARKFKTTIKKPKNLSLQIQEDPKRKAFQLFSTNLA